MMKSYTLVVHGMKCGGCTSKIEKHLSEMEEVSSFDVSLEEKTVKVQGEKIKGMAMKKAVEELGFSVESLRKG